MNSSTSKNQCKTNPFQNLKYVLSSKTEDILLGNESDPDNNFLNSVVHFLIHLMFSLNTSEICLEKLHQEVSRLFIEI